MTSEGGFGGAPRMPAPGEGDPSGGRPNGGFGGAPRMPGPGEGHPWWVRVGVIGGLLLIAFFGARSCQQSQVRFDQEDAIASAKAVVDFKPQETQVRLLRQGLNRKPVWFVSLAVTSKKDPDVFSRLAVVEVDANNGKVVSIKEDSKRDKEAAQQTQGKAPGEPVEP